MVAAAVWLWSLRWSSAHVPPVTAQSPCCQPKQPWGQPRLRRKERRKLGMRTSVGRSSEPPSELHARSLRRLPPNRSRMQKALGERGGGALRRIEMCSDGKGRGGECDGRKKRDLQINNERIDRTNASASMQPGGDVAGVHPVQCRFGRCEPSPGADVEGRCPMCPVPAQMWHSRTRSRRRSGRDEPRPCTDVARMRPDPVLVWHGAPCPGADVEGRCPDPAKMWQG